MRLAVVRQVVTAAAVEPKALEATVAAETGRPCVAFNMGLQGDGPISQLVHYRRLRDAGVKPDVTVVDLNLPTISGLDACRQITQKNPLAKVIVFTAMNDPDVRQRSFEVGASAFVSKIACDGDLLATVKRLVST